jgi:hypothetical protein
LSLGHSDVAKASEYYDAAATAVGQELEFEGVKNDPETVFWQARLFRLGGEQLMQLDNATGALERFHRSLDTLRLIGLSQMTPSMEQVAAVTQADFSG